MVMINEYINIINSSLKKKKNDKSEILDFEQQNDQENGEIYDNEIDDPRFLLNDDGEYVDDMEPEDEY